MKKLMSLQVLMLMSLAVGSISMIDANDAYKSSENKSQVSGHPEMKKIEHELHTIKMEFEHAGYSQQAAQSALKKLDGMQARIARAVAEMKRSEEHGTMWKKHERTLKDKVERLRKYIKSHTKKA